MSKATVASAPAAPATSLATRLTRSRVPAGKQVVTIDTSDGAIAIEFRSLSAETLLELQQRGMVGGDDEREQNQATIREFYPLMIQATAHDPATGALIWTPEQRADILQMDYRLLMEVGKHALAVCGMGVEAQANVRGNSDAEPAAAGSDSASTSPASSTSLPTTS